MNLPLNEKGYPVHWPRPYKHKPTALASRITEQQKLDLYHRRVTTRDLAKILGVHERYMSQVFSGKIPVTDKKPLIEARKLFKLAVAEQIIAGKYTITEASKVANVSYNTMRRFLERAKVKAQAKQQP